MANIFHINRPTNKITLGTTDTTIVVTPLTASKTLALNASKELESVQDIRTTAIPEFAGLVISGTTAIGIDMSSGTFATADIKLSAANILTDAWLGSVTNTFLGIDVCGLGNLAAGGLYNTAIGNTALEDIATGTGNTAVGWHAVGSVTVNNANTGIGFEALGNNTGVNNTAIGTYAGIVGSGSNCVFLGGNAGRFETGSNKLFIDGLLRTNETDARVKALIYGVFAAATADQSLTVNANLIVSESISSGTSTFSTEGPTDNVDVSGVNTLFLDCSANDVTIGGFTGGVNGQVLYVARLCAGAFSGILEHIEGGGSQDICLHAGADETLDTEYGGWVLVCNGTSWFDTSHAKHV